MRVIARRGPPRTVPAAIFDPSTASSIGVTWLFLMKVTVTPALVALMSLAARRFGATIGGMLMGLPWMTGPVLFFLTFEKGEAWCAGASLGATIAVLSIGSFMLAYGVLAHRLNPLLCWVAGGIAFACVGVATLQVSWTPVTAAIAGTAGLILVRWAMPRPRSGEMPRPLPWWDIPMRMATSAAMVTALSFLADLVAPRTSGVLASYPVILTSVCLFMHFQWGADAVLRVFGGLSLSLISFVAFFTIVGVMVESHGVVIAYSWAALAGVASSAVLMWIERKILKSR